MLSNPLKNYIRYIYIFHTENTIHPQSFGNKIKIIPTKFSVCLYTRTPPTIGGLFLYSMTSYNPHIFFRFRWSIHWSFYIVDSIAVEVVRQFACRVRPGCSKNFYKKNKIFWISKSDIKIFKKKESNWIFKNKIVEFTVI